MLWHRLISLIIAIIYLVFALKLGTGEDVLNLFMYLVIPMATIWFGDEMGSLTGIRLGGLGRPVVDKESPGCLVRLLGWMLLLLPILYVLIMVICDGDIYSIR